MSARDPHGWHINGVPINVLKTQLIQTRWFFHFLPGLLHLIHDLIRSFSSQPLQSCQWPPDQVTWKTECLEPTPRQRGMKSQCQKGPEEMGALGSSPSSLPSWSLARGSLPNHPNTRYYIGIHDISDETGAVPPTIPCLDSAFSGRYSPLCRTGLTKGMVKGPHRAVLSYGRCSLEGGLSPHESRDAAFMLTGAGTWVGKPAYLAADPLTIQEGW